MILGIDIGTTNCKLAVYDMAGIQLAQSSFPTPAYKTPEGWDEYNPDTLWESLSQAAAGMLKLNGLGKQIKSLAISSQCESGLLVDADGNALTPIIPWYCERTKSLVDLWSNRMSTQEIFEITGLTPNYIFGILKLEWVKLNQPEIYKKAYRWHSVYDYLYLKICGRGVMDYSQAGRMMAFDINTRQWSDKILSIADIRPDLLPEVVQAGTPIDHVKNSVALDWGISPDVIAVAGGFDHLCGCIGIHAADERQVVDSIGTSESICYLRGKRFFDGLAMSYAWGPHVVKDAYYQIGGMVAGGKTIEWGTRNVLNRPVSPQELDNFNQIAAQSKPGSGGVVFQPHLKGSMTPYDDQSSAAGFWGISMQTTNADLCRAIFEGMTMELRLILESTENHGLDSIVAIGAGTRNVELMQIRADVLRMPILIPDCTDVTLLGAATLAAYGVGLIDTLSLGEARFAQIYEPRLENYDIYNELYHDVYLDLYASQKQIAHKLAKFR